MKSFALVFLLLAIFATKSQASRCVVGNKVLSPGQSMKHPDDQCVTLTCLEDGSTNYLSCPLPALAEGCKDEGYKYPNLPYPNCCERIIKCV